MPRLSESMEEGTILGWLKPEGAMVSRDEDLVEIEAEKATMTYAAEADGHLRILAAEGVTVGVGEPIAHLDPNAPDSDEGEKGLDSAPATGRDEPEPEVVDRNATTTRDDAENAPEDSSARKVSPLARRLAMSHRLELARIDGSGPGGWITRADVEAALDPGARRSAARSDVAPSSSARKDRNATDRSSSRLEEPTAMQRSIAERMVESKLTAPDFGLLIDVDMSAALELVSTLKRDSARGGAVPSINDLMIKAAASALAEFPRANGSFRDGCFEFHDRVNIGFAVAIEGGLLVPTIADAERKTLGEIAAESRRLAERARNGTIGAAELSGGTFTISNLGMYGTRAILPVINPGEAAILGVGAVEERVVAVDGAPAVLPQVSLSLTCDHRILYGAEAAQFLAEVRSNLEQPLRMTL